MIKATAMAKRLRWLPISYREKEHIILANILPAAFYGVETSRVNKNVLKALRAAIANAIGPRSARASNDIVYYNTSCSADLDPETYILTERVLGLRRPLAKKSNKQDKVNNIMHHYNSQGHLLQDHDNSSGPIGLLISSLDQVGAKLSNDLKVSKDSEADIDIWHMPWQHLEHRRLQLNSRYKMSMLSTSPY